MLRICSGGESTTATPRVSYMMPSGAALAASAVLTVAPSAALAMLRPVVLRKALSPSYVAYARNSRKYRPVVPPGSAPARNSRSDAPGIPTSIFRTFGLSLSETGFFAMCSLLCSDGTARSWLPQPLRAVAWVSGKIGFRTVRRCPAGVLASTDSKTDRRLWARNLSQGVCTASLRGNCCSERQVKKDYPPPILGRQEAVKHVPDFLRPSARSPQRKGMFQGTSANASRPRDLGRESLGRPGNIPFEFPPPPYSLRTMPH